MSDQLQAEIPKVAAAVLHSDSPQGDLMRYGRLPPKPPAGVEAVESPRNTLAVSTAIYDGLAVLYNDAEPGTMLIVSLPNKPTMGNLHRILKGRGLELKTDYLAYKAKFDVDGFRYPVKERPLVIERLTDTLMRVSTGRQNLGREIAAAAREIGDLTPALTHAPKKPGSREEREAELLRQADEGDNSPLGDLIERSQKPVPLSSKPPKTPSALDVAESRALEEMELPTPRIGS